MSFYGFRYILNTIGLHQVFLVLKYSILVVAIVGWFDLAGILGLVPSSIREFVQLAMTGKSSGRLILTVSEPAWASRLILCLLPFCYYFWNATRQRRDLFILGSFVIFFFLTFSLSGVLVLLVASGLYLINNLSLKKILQISTFLVIGFVALASAFSMYSNKGGYFTSRITKITELQDYSTLFSLNNLAAFDGSSFIRIGYPIISGKVFLDNPLGIGIGQYGLYFNEYVAQYGKHVTQNKQVVGHVKNENADQRSYYTKVLTDNGLILSIVLIYFYWLQHKKLKYLLKLRQSLGFIGKEELLFISLILVYANMIQFASYLFPFYWFIPALISHCYDKKTIL